MIHQKPALFHQISSRVFEKLQFITQSAFDPQGPIKITIKNQNRST